MNDQNILLDYTSYQMFNNLKSLFEPYEKDLLVVVDQTDTYYLDVPEYGSEKKGTFFGAVQLRDGYTTFHFAGFPKMPELLDVLPSDFFVLQNSDGTISLMFKAVKKTQLIKLSHILSTYADMYLLSERKQKHYASYFALNGYQQQAWNILSEKSKLKLRSTDINAGNHDVVRPD